MKFRICSLFSRELGSLSFGILQSRFCGNKMHLFGFILKNYIWNKNSLIYSKPSFNAGKPVLTIVNTSSAHTLMCALVLSGSVQTSWHGHWLSHHQWGAFRNHRLLCAICWDRHQRYGCPEQWDGFTVSLSRWERRLLPHPFWLKPIIASILLERHISTTFFLTIVCQDGLLRQVLSLQTLQETSH